MIVAALVEMDNDVELRHGRRLLRGARNHADVALARMPEEVGPVRAEGVRLQSDLRSVFDNVASPRPTRPSYASRLSPRHNWFRPNLTNEAARANEPLNMFAFRLELTRLRSLLLCQ